MASGEFDSSGRRTGEAPADVKVGDRAPEFTLPDRSGRAVSLRDFRGSTVVLYFYPRDHTSICTAQACDFRDRYEMFRVANAVIVGVSSDSVATHQKFADQHGLPFHLLADENGRVRARYGVQRVMGVLPGRVTFVIDGKGVVRHIIKALFSPGRHIREALQVASQIARDTPPP
jgi:peroxiredoxin Q/BCP